MSCSPGPPGSPGGRGPSGPSGPPGDPPARSAGPGHPSPSPPQIGLVGVGPWGITLASSLQRFGAQVVAYDRKRFNNHGIVGTPAPRPYALSAPLLTNRIPWPHMIASQDIDALIIATPPETALEIATTCAAAGKAVLVTKPLGLESTPVHLTAPFYVDYLHIWSPCWHGLRTLCRRREMTRIEVHFFGRGPIRSFPALDDYGSHAFAMLHDLIGYQQVLIERAENEPGYDGRMVTMVSAKTADNGIVIELVAGNRNPSRGLQSGNGERSVQVTFSDGSHARYEEKLEGTERSGYLTHGHRHERVSHDARIITSYDPLSRMSKAFLRDLSEKKVNPAWAEMSVLVHTSLRAVHRHI